MDVPIEIALKRLLICSQRNDWAGCEQAMRAVEKHEVASPLLDLKDPATGSTPLMYAAIENKVTLIEKMIRLGNPVNHFNKENYSAVHLAFMYSREETVNFLLNQSNTMALVSNVGGPKKQNCLHLAAARTTKSLPLQVIRDLINNGKDLPLQKDEDGNIPIMTALEANNVALCHELLSLNLDIQIRSIKAPLNDTLLHLATRRRNTDMIKAFIEHGCSVDKVNAEGQTCLHIAALNGDEMALRLLFMARANPSLEDSQDRTPIYLAAERGHTQAVDYLADKFKASVYTRAKDGSTLLHVAALHGHSETAMVLHKRGVPLLMPNRNGARGIHTAAQKGHVGVINAIILKGEDVNVLTNHNFSALHLAIEAGRPEVVECLLGHGANVRIKGGSENETPLHMACRLGEARGEKCVRMLLKSGANPNLPLSDGRTPLHLSAQVGGSRNIRLLLDNGGNIATNDQDGESAIHKAVRGCHHKTLKCILDFLSKYLGDCSNYVTQENKMGETPLHLACNIQKGQLHFPNEDIGIMNLILKHGGTSFCLKMTRTTKETALHYVANNGNAELLSNLFQALDPGQIQLGINSQSAIGWSPLCAASARGHFKCVEIMLKHNVRVDVFDHEGKSSLHLASEYGSEEVCKALIEANSFVNSKTKAGWTALHFAAQKGHGHLIDLLVKQKGATLDALTMKKQTPLHLGATYGQIEICRMLVELGASLDAADDNGQKPIHLAAQANQATVILMLLEARPSLVSAATKDGNTCAHIAAKKGSALVISELMKFDKTAVISSKHKNTECTALHIATEGGHKEVVQILLSAGASLADETRKGNTPIHIAAQNGYWEILALFAKNGANMRVLSRRSGFSALHMAALYGETEAVRELLIHVPSHLRSVIPASVNSAEIKELSSEEDLTALHLASFSGSDDVVRALLNSSGTSVDSATTPTGYTALHLACSQGHIGVVGLLLSRSTALLKVVDSFGRTCLHVSARSGHHEMVQVLLGQGAELNAKDHAGWLSLHYAAKSGYLNTVKLLVDNGSSTTTQTSEGYIPLWYSTSAGKFNVSTYLLRQDHQTEILLKDRKFCYNLMVMGKSHQNKCLEDFVFLSPAPCYTASNLSALYRNSALKEKDRAADLIQIGDWCEELNKDLLSIASNIETSGAILNSIDESDTSFIDTLINNEQKIAISQYAVQEYLQEIWQGELHLKAWQFILFFASFVLIPPLWFMLSMPVEKGLNKVPVVKFMSYLTSHLYFMAFLTLISVAPPDPTTRESMIPYWYEIVVWVWYLGLLLSQITNPGAKGGLSWAKYVLVVLGVFSYIAHGVGIFVDPSWWSFVIYVRNLFYGVSLLVATILILDFLSFHHLFGPWAIIIGELIIDVGKFVVVLSLFIAGYSLMVSSMNLPFGFENDYEDGTNRSLSQKIAENQDVVQPFIMFELLFFSLFGFQKPEDFMISSLIQSWTLYAFKLVFATYLLLTVVVLINLLIAMMSDTYQRIQQQSDIEWKYGLAKLIRNMQKTQVAPSPLNLLTTWMVVLHSWFSKGRMEKEVARKKFRQVLQDEISKASGMKFSVDLKDKPKATPRVIHALGNIKWGFSDGLRPLPVEKVQSKWDFEHELKSRGNMGSSTKLDEFVPTSKVVSWPKVIRKYLTLNDRENELKAEAEQESNVMSIMKSLVNLRDDEDSRDMARAHAVKWGKVPAQTKKDVLQKWEEKANEAPNV